MMQNKTLAKKIEELKKLKDQKDIIDAQMTDIKNELIEYLQEKEIDSYEFSIEDVNYKFSNKTETQMRFDSKEFKEEYADLYESFRRATPVTKFLFS